MIHCDHCDRDRLKRLLDESLPEAMFRRMSLRVRCVRENWSHSRRDGVGGMKPGGG